VVDVRIQTVSESLDGFALAKALKTVRGVKNGDVVMVKWVLRALEPERQLDLRNVGLEIFDEVRSR
jgi:hypothetical protein